MTKAKFTTIALATFMAMRANAAELESPAYISQIDSSSFSTVSMMDIVKPTFRLAENLGALQPSNGNLGLIWQEGDTNVATITQTGAGNVGLIRQIGLENTASITQKGVGHRALVLQQGRGNVAIIRQR